MRSLILLFFPFIFLTSCKDSSKFSLWNNTDSLNSYSRVSDISLPPGYRRLRQESGSFGTWLRNIQLKQDNKVYLYNGRLKRNQNAQFKVLDISVGDKDLQQCADAVMRLRAEYLYAEKRYNEIVFSDNTGKEYKWENGNNRKLFDHYLENVFSWCGTASLEKQLQPIKDVTEVIPGDVLIKGGYPGHAMLVVDAAINGRGQKIVMLAQSYMPAQDIHIVVNPMEKEISPWYELKKDVTIITPEWTFYSNQFKSW